MKILNLYAGIGGNRKLWGNEHEITAVEFEPYIAEAYKKLYPSDTVVIADAHQYLLDHYKEFDIIWSSPPCPTHSRMRNALITKSAPVYPDMKLYEEIIFLKHFFKGHWVVENVVPYYEPLIDFKTEIDRHLFWSDRWLGAMPDNKHGRTYNVTRAIKEELAAQHNIVLPEGTKNQRKLLRNAVQPEIGKYILRMLML